MTTGSSRGFRAEQGGSAGVVVSAQGWSVSRRFVPPDLSAAGALDLMERFPEARSRRRRKRRLFCEDPIVRIIKEQEAGLVTAVMRRQHGFSPASLSKPKAKYGGLEMSDARCLRHAEDESGKLKQPFRRERARQGDLEGPDGNSLTTPGRRRAAALGAIRANQVSQRRPPVPHPGDQ